MINIALSKDRDEKLKLLYPPDKEFISSTEKIKLFFLYIFGKRTIQYCEH